MTDRLKVADLPQEEREQLLQRAGDAGIKNAMIATWYVDTLEAKIAAAVKPKDEQTPADTAQKDNTDTGETSADDEEQDDKQTPAGVETPADVSEIDSTSEADDLDEDVEPAAPVVKEEHNNKTKKSEKTKKITICHICRGKVINGKCQACGFDISKR